MTLQQEVSDWAVSVFGKSSNSKGKIRHLFSELEEIFAECENDIQREEVADAGLILLHLALDHNTEITNITPQFEFHMRKKFEICKNRKWERAADGLMRHIK